MMGRPALWWLGALGAAGAAWALLTPRRSGELTDSGATALDVIDNAWSGLTDDDMTIDQERALLGDPRVRAFLTAIQYCEHLARDVDTGDAYRTFYGGSRFDDLTDHPVITGELAPVALPAQTCINAGYTNGVCYSTAAGAYQITRPTWQEFRAAGDLLPDFGADSQDLAALRILRRVGSLDKLLAGDLRGAVAAASSRWASLPGNSAKQRQRTFDQFAGYYRSVLG